MTDSLIPMVGVEGPCTVCRYKATCKAYKVLKPSLFRSAAYRNPPPLDQIDQGLDALFAAFIAGVKGLELTGELKRTERGLFVSAFFDLAATALYTNALLKDETSFTLEALASGYDEAFFPYTWMCPKSVAAGADLALCHLPGARREGLRDFPIAEKLAKPGGRAIGDVGIKILRAILRGVLAATDPSARMRDGGGHRGEFDLTITTAQQLMFMEVKAKPLIAYPLRLTLKEKRANPSLKWMPVRMDQVSTLALYLAASSAAIPLSKPAIGEFTTWPLRQIADALTVPKVAKLVVENWKLHLAGYRQWEDESPRTRWHRFGCGNFNVLEQGQRIEKRVANTKELPGLDRTDDIKKGAAQLLKFSRFKFDCPADAISCLLAGNTYAETHSEDYLDPILTLKITRAGDPGGRAEWIFDAVIGLTQNYFNKLELAKTFDLAAL